MSVIFFFRPSSPRSLTSQLLNSEIHCFITFCILSRLSFGAFLELAQRQFPVPIALLVYASVAHLYRWGREVKLVPSRRDNWIENAYPVPDNVSLYGYTLWKLLDYFTVDYDRPTQRSGYFSNALQHVFLRSRVRAAFRCAHAHASLSITASVVLTSYHIFAESVTVERHKNLPRRLLQARYEFEVLIFCFNTATYRPLDKRFPALLWTLTLLFGTTQGITATLVLKRSWIPWLVGGTSEFISINLDHREVL